MTAFLLAAGKGTRLRPITDRIPKCLVPINGVPLLAIWFRLLAVHGVDTVIVNLHHHADKVHDFIKTFSAASPLRIVPFHEPRLLGSAGTVWANRDRVDGATDFLIAYADNLTDCDLTAMKRFHRRVQPTGVVLTMGLIHAPDPSACGIAQLDDDARIVSFVEKPSEPVGDLANAGIYVASRDVFDYFPPHWETAGEGVLDFGFHVLPRLTGKMAGHVIDGYLRDIGTVAAYRQAQDEWKWKQDSLPGSI